MSDTVKKMTGRLTSRGMHHWFDEHVSEDGLKRQEQEVSVTHSRLALVFVSTDDKVPEVMTKDQVRAMLAEILQGLSPDDFYCGDCTSHYEIREVAAKHGITL